MNLGKSIPVNLHILGKDYVVACPEEERDTLMDSAQYFNEKVQEVREGGKVVSTERIVVVSALNIIHEYLQYQQQQENDRLMFGDEIGEMEKKIKLALSEIK
ncbi:MAG: cell division protein ZapA [Gammaproteobacteria bacterium]|nr:MAG: cell division protein ZapA [Gammaproteobacteria bacterium]RKZ38897.1 MAG: cell division protein ZapA [Gammaproteobacteria bacterium]RKZ75686.1 MAG: cell division protein ZapA [Gammaproteobacteria bacterium]